VGSRKVYETRGQLRQHSSARHWIEQTHREQEQSKGTDRKLFPQNSGTGPANTDLAQGRDPLEPITEIRIERALKAAKGRTAPGEDGLPTLVWKKTWKLGSLKVLTGRDDLNCRGAGVKRTLIKAIDGISADGKSLDPLIIWPATTHRNT
jgi:hypothetical protein